MKGIPCSHGTCSHESDNASANLDHGALHFTASVMGNPEYLKSVEKIKPAKDERMVGIEKLNTYHAHHFEERKKRQEKK